MPATRSTQRFCPECGAKVTKTQKFCRECGTDLQAATTEGAPEPARSSARSRKAPTTSASTGSSTRKPSPPPPPPPSLADLPPPSVPEAASSAPATIAVPAWIAAGACGVLAVATGLPWFSGGFTVDGFDIPLASLVSDTALEGIPLAVVFLITAGVGLGVALIIPTNRALMLTFMVTGAVSVLLVLWYMFRVITNLEGAPLFDALSLGFWLAFVGSLGILVGGVALTARSRS